MIFLFLRCIPNLRALEFESCRTHGLDLRLHSLATACPKITVIKLPNIRTLNEEVLKRIVFEVKLLQVLEVRLHSGDLKQLSDGDVSNLLGNATSIISLLGILADESFNVLPNIKFKSCPAHSDIVLISHNVNRWQKLSKHSKHWNEAHGLAFFYPKDSICSIKLSQHLQCHFDEWTHHMCI